MPLGVSPCAECAVKTIVAKGKTFNERLAAFETEAKVSWLASQAARKVSSPQRFLLLLLLCLLQQCLWGSRP